MDPRCPGPCWLEKRLPRTRGDGPQSPPTIRPQRAAPPHTRGWTLIGKFKADDGRGSPAHAGMDPTLALSSSTVNRLPRTRGDGPVPPRGDVGVVGAPPHTRGWTRQFGDAGRNAAGSPAHAGMDPARAAWCGLIARLPRTRGDGPRPRTRPRPVARAPPHTRGWTRDFLGLDGIAHGSPAHAGMDP